MALSVTQTRSTIIPPPMDELDWLALRDEIAALRKEVAALGQEIRALKAPIMTSYGHWGMTP